MLECSFNISISFAVLVASSNEYALVSIACKYPFLLVYIKSLCKKLKIEKVRQLKNEIILEPLTKYKTKEMLGHKIVKELEELLEKMLKLNN